MSHPNEDKLHGYPVIRSATMQQRPGTRPGRVVLVDRGTESPRYVVARHYGTDSEWCNGDYIDDKKAAVEAFNTRAAVAGV